MARPGTLEIGGAGELAVELRVLTHGVVPMARLGRALLMAWIVNAKSGNQAANDVYLEAADGWRLGYDGGGERRARGPRKARCDAAREGT
jgi:hypothetical protein